MRLKSSRLQPTGEKVNVTFHQDYVELYDAINQRSLDPGVKRDVETQVYVDARPRRSRPFRLEIRMSSVNSYLGAGFAERGVVGLSSGRGVAFVLLIKSGVV